MAKVRLEDLAKAAKVSISTVSLALRDHPGISRATKKRVMELQKKMGYLPPRQSMAAPQDRRPRILFCLLRREQADPLYSPFLEGVAKGARHWKARLAMDFVQLEENMATYVFRMQDGEMPDGIILAGAVSDEIVEHAKADGAVVLVLGSHHFELPVHQVQMDLQAMARMTIKRALEEGARNIAILCLRDCGYNKDYADALRIAAARQGMPVPEEQFFTLENLYQDMETFLPSLVDLKPKPIAIISTTTGISHRILETTQRQKLKCKHYSIFFEDRYHPDIACIDMDQKRLGLVGVDRLCHLLSGTDAFSQPYTCLIPPAKWRG